MSNKNILFDDLISIINKCHILELNVFIEYITKHSIYFYEFISKIKNNKSVLKKIIHTNIILLSFYKYLIIKIIGQD